MLTVGTKAPHFSLPNQKGQLVHLNQFLGKKVVLYFYPKDNTPGCTRQACAFREMLPVFEHANVVVLGVSKDGANSHQKFASQYGLPFELLSDENLEVMKAYGVWGEKKLYGKTFLGVNRATYVLDEEGKVLKVYPKANPDTNASDIAKFLKLA